MNLVVCHTSIIAIIIIIRTGSYVIKLIKRNSIIHQNISIRTLYCTTYSYNL